MVIVAVEYVFGNKRALCDSNFLVRKFLNKIKDASDYFIFYEGLHNTSMKSVFSCLKYMLNYDVKAVLGKMSIPVLVIEGEKDRILPEIDSFEIYEQIKKAEIDYIPMGKHFVILESPKLVDRYILHFLKKHHL